jgi:hypothetical protein
VLSRLVNSAFEYAVNEHIRIGRSFPKPIDLRELASTYRITDDSKQITYTDDRRLPEDRRDKHAADAAQVFQLMFSNAPLEHKVEAFRVMSRAYPGIGWDTEGIKFKRYYEQNAA